MWMPARHKKGGWCGLRHYQDAAPILGTLTYANFRGRREFSGHELIAKELGINVYFAKPYHSWERGCNENCSGLLRQLFPKGSSFENISPEKFPICTYLINSRPRKKLGFISPISKLTAIFAQDNRITNLIWLCCICWLNSALLLSSTTLVNNGHTGKNKDGRYHLHPCEAVHTNGDAYNASDNGL